MLIKYKGHKIFAFADTHGMYRRLNVPADADVLICAGDACEGFAVEGLRDFFSWYNSLPAKLRIFVAGNHDMVFDEQPDYARSHIPAGVSCLENDGIEFEGIKFYSVPARPYLIVPATIPEGGDFLITHGPAYGYLDRGLGCKNLFLSMASAHPKYHVFGHIHEEGLKRKAVLGGTTFLNVSYFDDLRKQVIY